MRSIIRTMLVAGLFFAAAFSLTAGEKNKKSPLDIKMESVYFEGESLEAACESLTQNFQDLDPKGRKLKFVFEKGVDKTSSLDYVRYDDITFTELFDAFVDKHIKCRCVWTFKDGNPVVVTFKPEKK